MHPLGRINSAFIKALELADENQYAPCFTVTLQHEDVISNNLQFI